MFNLISALRVDQIEYSHFYKIHSCKNFVYSKESIVLLSGCVPYFLRRQVEVERRNVLTFLLDSLALFYGVVIIGLHSVYVRVIFGISLMFLIHTNCV